MPVRTLNDVLPTLVGQWEYLVLFVAAAAILSSVAIRFSEKGQDGRRPVTRERHLMATLTMTLFFFGIYYLGRLGVGRLDISPPAELASKIAGCVLVVAAAIVNLAARWVIGRYWSDQIEIQEDHQVVRQWPYNWVRHPMYSSLVFFGVGMGLLAVNPPVIALTLLAFLPAMAWRAKREEANLMVACNEQYAAYCRSVPRMVPRLPEGVARVARGGLGLMQLAGIWTRQLDLFLLSAVLTLGLSFVMQREDFRIAYKIKTAMILVLCSLAAYDGRLFVLLWIPVAASLMSLSGQCPGTLLVRLLQKEHDDGKPL